jgi:hypothetical protein
VLVSAGGNARRGRISGAGNAIGHGARRQCAGAACSPASWLSASTAAEPMRDLPIVRAPRLGRLEGAVGQEVVCNSGR